MEGMCVNKGRHEGGGVNPCYMTLRMTFSRTSYILRLTQVGLKVGLAMFYKFYVGVICLKK